MQKSVFQSLRAPRYTSYPTAPIFSPQVGPQVLAGWLAEMPEGARISLYLHVPFCRRLCWFCACRTQGTASMQPVDAYLQSLLTEIAMLRRLLPGGVTVSRLHWGGGTPTLLGPGQIRRLARALADSLPFAPGHEFSVEIDPNELDGTRADALAESGLTRASIGVQDFDPGIQTAIGRSQSFEVTQAAAELLRARGVASLNVDLLYGLPFQTVAKIETGTARVLDLRPDRVALYGYAHVPWMARRQTMLPVEALPGPEARLELAAAAAALFVKAGYRALGIDHFALPQDGLARAAAAGRMRRNFQGYTDDGADILLGLGASAISRLPQGYAQNAAATGAYQKAVRDGRLATARGHAFAGDDRLRGRVIESLMCDFRADLPALAAEFGGDAAPLLAIARGVGAELPGATRLRGGMLEVTAEGRPLVRLVAQRFDAYAAAPAGYSLAV